MTWRSTFVEAVVVATVAALVGLVFNAARSNGLQLIAETPYQILVPCPEPGGPVQPVSADDPALTAERTFLVDARSVGEFDRHHLRGAVNVPYDWLDPVPEDRMRQLAAAIAASGANRVAVYGDGGRPDNGKHLGREISGSGIKNVYYVVGGAPALLGESSR